MAEATAGSVDQYALALAEVGDVDQAVEGGSG